MLFLLSCRWSSQVRSPTSEALAPGDYTRTLSYAERQRSYMVHIPTQVDPSQPSAVVLIFHGGGGNAENVAAMTHFSQQADKSGFIAVYPNGTGRYEDKLLTWNGGTCCGYAQEQAIDDVGFVGALLNDLRTIASVDGKRIYATGMSNGGIMSYRLACAAADLIAAIAPVAGTQNHPDCAPSEPVAVLHIHGTADEHLPYEGGVGAKSLVGGQHAWPGGEPGWPGGDEPGMELNATEVIWTFFAAHAKP